MQAFLPRIAVRARRPGMMMCLALGHLPQSIPPHTYLPLLPSLPTPIYWLVADFNYSYRVTNAYLELDTDLS